MPSNPAAYLIRLVLGLTPLEFTFGKSIKNRLADQIQVRNAPVNLSLRLVARYNDRDHPMSTITCAAGKGTNYYVVGDDIKDPPPAKIDHDLAFPDIGLIDRLSRRLPLTGAPCIHTTCRRAGAYRRSRRRR